MDERLRQEALRSAGAAVALRSAGAAEAAAEAAAEVAAEALRSAGAAEEFINDCMIVKNTRYREDTYGKIPQCTIIYRLEQLWAPWSMSTTIKDVPIGGFVWCQYDGELGISHLFGVVIGTCENDGKIVSQSMYNVHSAQGLTKLLPRSRRIPLSTTQLPISPFWPSEWERDKEVIRLMPPPGALPPYLQLIRDAIEKYRDPPDARIRITPGDNPAAAFTSLRI